jgi:hypothetical protein
VAAAGDVDDDRVVDEPVEHGGGDGGVGEDVAPGADAAVSGQDDRAAPVALADDPETALVGALGGHGQESCRGHQECLNKGRRPLP